MKLSDEQFFILSGFASGHISRSASIWKLWDQGLIENRGGGPDDFHLTDAGHAAMKEAGDA